MAVEPVEVEYAFSGMRNKKIQVSRLQRDGFLLVKGDPEVWIQSNPADLLSVRFLELNLDEEVEKIGDSIGQLSHLIHLSIDGARLKCLPNSISSLPNLQRLQLDGCFNLQEFPANLGDLNSLTFLSLDDCDSIKSLPNSISKLSNLTSLHLLYCESLEELPAISNVVELILIGCYRIQSLPEGLCSLKKLHLFECISLTELPTDLNLLQLKIKRCCSIQSLPKDLTNLQQLHLPLCSKMRSLANLVYFRSLWHLTLNNSCSCGAHLEELPANLVELSELLTLNIEDTDIKWLPWSITKLSKLRLVSLPRHFRLETLPNHLKDSIVISVEDRHIRKTWQQLKTEIPIVGLKETHSPSAPGYLQYRADGVSFIWAFNNMISIDNLYSLVRILDLDLRDRKFDRNMINSIGKLPELTHLYISNGKFHNLPLPITRLAQLSLFRCDFMSCCDSLGKLSTLQSLTLLNCTNLPAHMDLPFSLTHFALDSCQFDSLPDIYMASMRKLSNLKSLELFGFVSLELSLLDLNLTKLKITDCFINSLPRCLQHLEIIHSRESYFDLCVCWDVLQVCLSEEVDLETLCVTCYDIKGLPSIARRQTLQELQLKDCFNLRKLPPDLDELVELCTLNVSGTRIKSLPNSITKLKNLQYLILPKYFKLESLPKNFEHKVSVSVDVTDDVYYEHEGYNKSFYNSSEDNEITSEVMEGGEEMVLQVSTHDSIIDLASSQSLLKPLPDATQVHEGSHFSSRTVPIDNGFSISQNLAMENLTTVNKDCVVPSSPYNFSNFSETDGPHFPSNTWQAHAGPVVPQGSSFNGRIDAVGESSSHALRNLQNHEMEILTNRDYALDFAGGPAAISSSNLHESQQGFHSGEMDIINLENEQRNQPCDSINSVHVGGSDYNALEDGQDKNHQSVHVKHKKTHKIEVPEKRIREKMSKGMTLEDAAKELQISKSTLKRKKKVYGIKWQSSRRKMQNQDAQNKKHNMVQLDGPNQDTLSDHALFEHNVVNQSSRDAILEEHTMPTQCQMEGHQYVGDPSNNAKESRSFNAVHQPNEISDTFVVKATFGEDTVKFDFSLSSSIEQLKEEVGKRLELEIGKFKIKYQDDKEWILITYISDLKDALRHSSESNLVRLLVQLKT